MRLDLEIFLYVHEFEFLFIFPSDNKYVYSMIIKLDFSRGPPI